MDVSDMQQCDIAERIKPEKLRFTQVLLRDRAYERAFASRESRSNADVKNFTASNRPVTFQVIPWHAAARRPGRTSHETEGPRPL